jgi:AcrR family transcriptional regulator
MPKVSAAHRDARRQQIIEAAVACFAREGFHRTSMQDIIKQSRLSAGAIYRYFAGKDAIVEAIAEERHAHESALLAQAIAHDDLAAGFRQLAHAYFDWLRDPRERRRRRVTVQIWAEALRSTRVAAIVQRGLAQRAPATKALKAAQRHGQLPTGLDADALSRFMLAVIQGFVLQQAWEPSVDIDRFLGVVDTVIEALFAPATARRASARRRR